MKKLVSLALVLVLAFASVAALADDTKSMTITLTLEQGYEWTVPESLTIYEFPTDKLKNEFDIGVTKWLRMNPNKRLKVGLFNYSGSVNLQNGGTVIGVQLHVKGLNDEYCYFDQVGTQKWSVVIPSSVSVYEAGEYSGTATFIAQLVDKAQ